jgi:type I restriction enzyme S subunit
MEAAVQNTTKRYDKYKPSGMEWLGDIPEHWEVRRIKYLFNEINERSEDGKEDLLSVSQYTGVTNKTDKVESGGMLTNALTLEGYKKVAIGDLVSNIMLAWNGSLGFSPFNGITSPAYSIYRIYGENNNRYFHYLLRTELYKSEFKRNSSGVIESRLRLYTDDFFNIESILPPLKEQTAIAEFLDDKTSKIDQAIAIKQQQINLLKERRQILIHKAVTQGINPDVKLKDSGVEWIGMIPESWEVKRLKYLANLVSLKILSKNSSLEYIGMENILSWTGEHVETNTEIDGLSNYFNKGDILFGKLRPYLAKVFLANAEGICSSEFLVYRVQSDIYNWYLKQLMLSFEFIKLIDSSTYGSKMPRANSDFIGNQLIPIPPKQEQKEISSYIENATNKIATAISLKEQEIEKLKEYKSSLIDGVVTGKVKIN